MAQDRIGPEPDADLIARQLGNEDEVVVVPGGRSPLPHACRGQFVDCRLDKRDKVHFLRIGRARQGDQSDVVQIARRVHSSRRLSARLGPTSS